MLSTRQSSLDYSQSVSGRSVMYHQYTDNIWLTSPWQSYTRCLVAGQVQGSSFAVGCCHGQWNWKIFLWALKMTCIVILAFQWARGLFRSATQRSSSWTENPWTGKGLETHSNSWNFGWLDRFIYLPVLTCSRGNIIGSLAITQAVIDDNSIQSAVPHMTWSWQ